LRKEEIILSNVVTLQAEFDSIEQAEAAALFVKEGCKNIKAIRFYHPRQQKREPPTMSALFINYGFSQTDPKGVEFNNPPYPPYLFRSRWESSRGEDSDLFSKDRCRVAVTLGEEELPMAEAKLINKGGRSLTCS